MKTLIYQTVLVSPSIAAEMLKGNTGNRPPRNTHVDFLAESMTRGEWRLTHQGVAISPSGRLLDGQHRLLAVIKSGVTVEMMVARNVQDLDFKYIDQGITRTAGDALGLSAQQVEVCRFLCLFTREGSLRKPTAEMVMEYFSVFSPALASIESRAKTRARGITAMATRAAVSVLYVEGFDVVNVYHEMALLNFDKIPNNAALFAKMYIHGAGLGGTGQIESFLLALKALDPRISDRKVLRNGSTDRAEAIARIKSIMAKESHQ